MLHHNLNSLLRRYEKLCSYLNAIAPKWEQLSAEKQARLKRITQRFIKRLESAFGRSYLKGVLGAAAVMLALGSNAQNFLPPVQDPFNLSPAGLSNLDFGDLDSDGDLDLIYSSTNYPAGFIAYRENIGTATNPNFATVQLNPFGISTGATDRYPQFVDIDGDGDLDLFSGNYDGEVRMFENIGSPFSPSFGLTFTNPFGITPVNFFYFCDPHFVDIDDDGDMDLITYDYPPGSFYANLLFQENTGTAQAAQFDTAVAVPFGLHQVAFGYSFLDHGDLDGDGDLDFLVGDFYMGDVRYEPNIGSSTAPLFGPTVVNTFGITPNLALSQPTLADLDGDNDLDLFLSDSLTISYMENTDTIPNVGIVENADELLLNISPNPSTGSIAIRCNAKAKLEVIDSQGKVSFASTLNAGVNDFDLHHLPSGLYTVRVNNPNAVLTKRLVLAK